MFLRIHIPCDPVPTEPAAVSIPTCVVGRAADCDLQLPHPTVSRRHCEISQCDENLTIRDLGSSNGTYLNGHLITHEQLLRNGDKLTLGMVFLEVLDATTGPVIFDEGGGARIPVHREQPAEVALAVTGAEAWPY